MFGQRPDGQMICLHCRTCGENKINTDWSHVSSHDSTNLEFNDSFEEQHTVCTYQIPLFLPSP